MAMLALKNWVSSAIWGSPEPALCTWALEDKEIRLIQKGQNELIGQLFDRQTKTHREFALPDELGDVKIPLEERVRLATEYSVRMDAPGRIVFMKKVADDSPDHQLQERGTSDSVLGMLQDAERVNDGHPLVQESISLLQNFVARPGEGDTYTVNTEHGMKEFYRPQLSLSDLCRLGYQIGGSLYGQVIGNLEKSVKGKAFSLVVLIKFKDQVKEDYQYFLQKYGESKRPRALRKDLKSSWAALSERRSSQENAFKNAKSALEDCVRKWGCESVIIASPDVFYSQYDFTPEDLAEADYILFKHRPKESSNESDQY